MKSPHVAEPVTPERFVAVLAEPWQSISDGSIAKKRPHPLLSGASPRRDGRKPATQSELDELTKLTKSRQQHQTWVRRFLSLFRRRKPGLVNAHLLVYGGSVR